MLQCGRKLSQHAARIYCHDIALKCHKMAKLYMLQCGRKLSQSGKVIHATMWQKIVTTCS